MKLGKAIQLSKSWEQILSEQGEINILGKYLPEINKLPCLIQCPYRIDKKPSLGLQFYQGRVVYKDFATGEKGGLLSLIKKITGKEINDICKDLDNTCTNIVVNNNTFNSQIQTKKVSKNVIRIRRRSINNDDISYWQSYGVNADVLENYGVYPIDYYWINRHRFKSDKLAYAYRIIRDKQVYYKIYQPYSKYKWSNNYPKDTVSLECYISNTNKPIILCSSVKDALCLKHNIKGLDVCALQGEGYNIPQSFLDKYKNRKIFILFDNDKAGINYSIKLSKSTQIPNIIIPEFEGGKDISDYFKCFGKDKFQTTFNQLICQCL